jgi:hypothetical protein
LQPLAEHTTLAYDGLTHRFTYGVNFSHQISATRTLATAFGGGAELVNIGTNQYWHPTYFASIGTDIGRSWSLHGNYSYMTVMLYSPLAAPDSYPTQTLVAGVGGDLTENLSLGMHFGASHGNVPANQSITGTAGQYSGVNGGAQLRVRLTTAWSAVASANYFRSNLVGAAAQFMRSSGNYEKTTLLGGFTWNVPLLDSGRTGRRSPG